MQEYLAKQIASNDVRSILQIGDSIWPELQSYCNENQCSFHYQAFTSALPSARFDLGIVVHGVENHSKQSITELLGVLKNQLCESICIGLPTKNNWTMQDFISLGFKRSSYQPSSYQSSSTDMQSSNTDMQPNNIKMKPSDTILTFYDYNMYDYNQKRSWNNSRFWANPEHFNTHRG